MAKLGFWALALAAGAALAGCASNLTAGAEQVPARTADGIEAPAAPLSPDAHPVAMRRLTEAQYRNTIADIFGSEIIVAGRFEPIVRPAHRLIATGASEATISPAGMEQFDIMARMVAGQVFDEDHRATMMRCVPANAAAVDAACSRTTLRRLGRLLFRRPLTEREQALYTTISDRAATATGSFYKGLELTLAAMLVSPDFLYVVERAEPDPGRPGELRLDSYSRAARLSYLLWNTTPDEPLLAAAGRGDLLDQQKLETIATAMTQSSRLEDGVRAFFTDMLMFEKFDELAKDPLIYPRFNANVAKAMPEQLLRMIAGHLLTDSGDYRDLFTTSTTYLNRPLGVLYAVPVRSPGWEKHDFGPDSARRGLLSQPGFLAIYAHSGRSSPTLRGRAIRELLMCQPVPNPPGNVNFTVVQDTSNVVLRTARMRLQAHATDPSCSGCHRITDPIGLSMETFDGIGAERRQENGADIDTAGRFENADFRGAADLSAQLSRNPAITQCVASRAYEYATGRSPEDAEPAVASLEKMFADQQYRIRALFQRIATLPAAYRVGGQEPTKPAQVAALPSGTGAFQ